ncbi:MAG: T9SS type A sorting domain-containing protein [Bacteroidetes bacterium]|nr:MAG: T9SS type A sorting domain-containing protein [Bacteroidota bacterium]
MTRSILFLFLLHAASSGSAQYLETFTGQEGKGLVRAICPAGTTDLSACGCTCAANSADNTTTCPVVPPDLTGVDWSLEATSFFTDNTGLGFEYSSPDDFGVVGGRMQVNDPDLEICWVGPDLNIAAAGAVSVSIDVNQTGGLEASDYIKAEYRLDNGDFVGFGYRSGNFSVPTTLQVAGLTGNTLAIRVCAVTSSAVEFIYFDNISVPQPGVTLASNTPQLSVSVSDVLCSGSSNGSVLDLHVTNGAPPYSFSWSNASTTEDLYDIPAGAYTVTVTDMAGVTATLSATVNEPPELSLSVVTTDVLCSGGNTGAVDLHVTGGTADYTYAWSSGAQDEDLDDLVAGTYTVVVTDQHGCTAGTSATLSEPPPLLVDAGACRFAYLGYGSTCTVLTASASGGSGGYAFVWDPGGHSGASVEVCPEVTTNYMVAATDANGCTATDAALVEIVDVRCGPPGSQKVAVCHKEEHEICIDAGSVPDHLAHGDHLGSCGPVPCAGYGQGFYAGGAVPPLAPDHAMDTRLRLYPNPASTFVQVHWLSRQARTVRLEVLDYAGRLLETLPVDAYVGVNIITIETTGFRNGIYWLRLEDGENSGTGRFVVLRN